VEGKRRDRRVRRTRQSLHDALRSLSLQKGYDHVTVQDVIDRANVGRATFYAHFRDKDDLLISGLGEMREFLRRHLATLTQAREVRSGAGGGFASVLFDHAAGHRGEYRALAGSRRGGTILKFAHNEVTSLIREYLDEAATRRGVKPVVPAEVTARYVASALLALLTWWLDDDVPYTAEQMGNMFERLTGPVVAAASGVSQ